MWEGVEPLNGGAKDLLEVPPKPVNLKHDVQAFTAPAKQKHAFGSIVPTTDYLGGSGGLRPLQAKEIRGAPAPETNFL